MSVRDPGLAGATAAYFTDTETGPFDLVRSIHLCGKLRGRVVPSSDYLVKEIARYKVDALAFLIVVMGIFTRTTAGNTHLPILTFGVRLVRILWNPALMLAMFLQDHTQQPMFFALLKAAHG